MVFMRIKEYFPYTTAVGIMVGGNLAVPRGNQGPRNILIY